MVNIAVRSSFGDTDDAYGDGCGGGDVCVNSVDRSVDNDGGNDSVDVGGRCGSGRPAGRRVPVVVSAKDQRKWKYGCLFVRFHKRGRLYRLFNGCVVFCSLVVAFVGSPRAA